MIDKEYLQYDEGLAYAGTHLIVDFWEARHLTNQPVIEQTLHQAAEISGATVLEIKLHQFDVNGGVTGIAILAESHISIHTWPEYGLAVLDLFMCGAANPSKALPLLIDVFQPAHLSVNKQLRGALLNRKPIQTRQEQ